MVENLDLNGFSFSSYFLLLILSVDDIAVCYLSSRLTNSLGAIYGFVE